jgi:hypothetical protein
VTAMPEIESSLRRELNGTTYLRGDKPRT